MERGEVNETVELLCSFLWRQHRRRVRVIGGADIYRRHFRFGNHHGALNTTLSDAAKGRPLVGGASNPRGLARLSGEADGLREAQGISFLEGQNFAKAVSEASAGGSEFLLHSSRAFVGKSRGNEIVGFR